MKNKIYYLNKYYKRYSIHYQWLYLLPLLFAIPLSSLSAQVLTYPKIYFPLDGSTTSPTRYTAATPGTKTDISAVVNGSVTSTSSRRGTANNALTFGANARLRIADAAGSNTSTSFFGINTAIGSDVNTLTISCWVYVDPTETTKRYLFYGTDNSGKLGFGLSVQGADLYLAKYVNNATADKGAALPNPTATQIGNTWEGKLWGPATFNAGTGWYQVILVQAPYYTRIFVGMPPNSNLTDGQGTKGKFDKDFTGSMLMNGKQSLTNFTKWGLGAPEGSTTAQPVQRIDDFMLFDYDMTPAEAEALYHCQVDKSVEACLGTGETYTSSFAIIGDYGCDGGVSTNPSITNPESYVANMVKSWSPNFIVSLGDDGYAATAGCGTSYADNVGKYYDTYIGTTTANNKFFPVMGNHDRDCPTALNVPAGTNYSCPPTSHYKCSCLWENYFSTDLYSPNNGRYYTFTQGNVQFFGLNSNKEEPDKNWFYVYETDGSGSIVYQKNCDGTDKLDVSGNKIPYFKFQRDASGNIVYTSGKDACGNFIPQEVKQLAPQAQWLKNSLSSSSASFKVVYMHHPPYASKIENHGGNGAQFEMSKWDFKALGADIVIAGDNHFYERNDSSSLTYLVNGVGGYKGLSTTTARVAGNRIHIEYEFGAVKVDANSETMRFRFYSIDPTNPNIRTSDRLRDEFYLRKRIDGSTYLVENPVELVSKKETLEEAITAYPNPTNGELTVRLQSATKGPATFKLLNLSGKLIYIQQEPLTKGIQELNLGNLKSKGVATGVYFLQVNTPEKVNTLKIIIQ